MLEKYLFKNEYWLIFLRKEFDTLNVIKSIKLKKPNKTYKLGKKQYLIDIEHPTYCKLNKKYYFIDIEKGSHLHFMKTSQPMSPEELDIVVGNKIITELTRGVMDNKKEKIFWLIAGAVLGGLLATSILLAYFNGKIEDLMKEQAQNSIPVIPTIHSIIQLVKVL
ncbi:MAG: hypothetical protein ACP6IY_20555 [Promethearchaeia archaeon]